ncbi:LacI family DNA-binding transcriptional regulator [bacterium]|nr:LacI family DNA-binding transcriptional regulator [bacterium]
MTTIKDIAEKAGVSIGTVDRVIHKRGRVSEETIRAVEKAIRDLNYTPNIFARRLKLAKPVTFGVLMPTMDQDSGYWRLPAAGIKKAKTELACHQVDVRFFHFDRYRPASFSRAFEAMLETDLDGLLIAPVLASLSAKLTARIPPERPYVFFDSTIPGSACLSCTIQDSYQSGMLSARLLNLLCGGIGTLAALRMAPDDYHINERVRGFQHYFSGGLSSGFVIYETDNARDRKSLKRLFRTIIEEHSGLRGIFITNAQTFLFARFLEEEGLAGAIHVIGYDLIQENIDCLKNGSIDFLISQQSDNQGYQGLYTLFRRVVLNEAVEKEIFMPIEIITRENIDYYQQQWSAHV